MAIRRRNETIAEITQLDVLLECGGYICTWR